MKSLYPKEHIAQGYYISDFSVGFVLKQEKKGKTIQIKETHLNHLLFLLEGELNVSYNEFKNHLCVTDEMIFVAADSSLVIETYTEVRYLLLSFNNQLSLLEQLDLQELKEFCNERNIFNKLDIRPPLHGVLESIIFYQSNKIHSRQLDEAKQKEIFLVLKSFYTKQELARFLKPILNQDMDFKAFIIKHYMDAKNVEELAQICDLSIRSLTRKFKLHFNDSPYRWMLRQKSHHVKTMLADRKIPMQQIIKDFGFSSPAHFTTYCKKHFEMTPSAYRKELNGGGK
ncbi:AraC-like DNA-binding protein [Parabacteroides sp. PF5-5]|uniref:helix-turn-helix domain-containing protein n=1 Tax=unclassified Parabacteroides TaxID=2649774 RepID=UPI0024735FDB|nr:MULTISPECIES: AraC family transcriptional regulator [unclassified Parabacteroides]MDH6304726.1 AraC-like DNA-binding protein [Parabacteroides sp. PH5-39]MDH6315659.1 AraC-like DNA-binding protein [Parabacteroides sp. PF5-13]MDH6319320.1 AraC-like DNA-binding protein [Parabacteroides sp. PH5-13]MDH6323051.1 AraC-like DNA-binding protein [Parabacteroides sp. PH5-8]MDH6326852.1 AraC-like DNA-binding protein [Parabacteroides sp. PH5-41]